jgi:hypothetical protein
LVIASGGCAPVGAAEFVPEGRLRLRQVVHGLQHGGRARPRLAAVTHNGTHRDGSDGLTVWAFSTKSLRNLRIL